MNHNFKPGDLALFIGEGFAGLETGSVVNLQELIPEGTVRHMPDNPIDNRYFHAPCDCWVVGNDGLDTYITSEAKLMPLRGDFDPARRQFYETIVGVPA